MKVALVTGSSKGIGKAIAKKLGSLGYTVGVNGRNESDLSHTISSLKSDGFLVFPVHLDLTSEENCKKAIDRIDKEYGRLDLLVTNIGSGKSTLDNVLVKTEWQRVFDINFFSAVYIIQESLRLLEKTQGQIISISSICGVQPIQAPLPYSVAKTSLISYVQNLAQRLASKKVRANIVSPGNVYFEGGSWDQKMKSDPEKIKKYISENVPMNSFINPEEIASTIEFISRTEHITGQNIIIDGGQTKRLI